jgi:hypothetical protein
MKLVVLGAAVFWALFRRPRKSLSMIATMSWFIDIMIAGITMAGTSTTRSVARCAVGLSCRMAM